MRKLILGSLIAATLAGVSIPAAARTDVYVSVAPPAAPYEVVPAPRAGYVWVPGYYDYRYNRYHWVRGRWVTHRPGHYYEPVRWVYRDGHSYRHGGAWGDADRDGVPNAYDHAPHNPYYR
jgi:hypothetical protein